MTHSPWPNRQQAAQFEHFLRSSRIFDPNWYTETYLDVSLSGMDPTRHFAQLGFSLHRDPGPKFSLGFLVEACPLRNPSFENLYRLFRIAEESPKALPLDPTRILYAACMSTHNGDWSRAAFLAERHLPTELRHTAAVLRANQHLVNGHEVRYCEAINTYLEQYTVAPISLHSSGGTMLERLHCETPHTICEGPLVSIIMVTRNAAQTVIPAADSILHQTWQNLELIVVDDCSEDLTWLKLRDLAASDHRVRLLRNRCHIGPHASKSIAAKAASGKYITCHNTNQWAHPQRIQMHLERLLSRRGSVKASISYGVQMDHMGYFSQINTVGKSSIDGVAHKCLSSCLFEESFFHAHLGAWDNVYLGGDEELVSRAECLLGGRFAEIAKIGTVCVELAEQESIDHGTDSGLSKVTPQPDEDYMTAWRDWHQEAKKVGRPLFIPCPPVDQRPFPAPIQIQVPIEHVQLNYWASQAPDDVFEPITAICVSKRPTFLAHVVNNIRSQSHPNVHVIYVAHGLQNDTQKVRRAFEGIPNVQILQVTNDNTFLADGLNMALEHCQTDLCAKIDDDDYYGPDYLRNAEISLKYCGIDNVALVGKASHFCYIEAQDVFALRFPQARNKRFKRVHGGSLVWRRSLIDDWRFERVRQGTDTRFVRAVLGKRLAIYSADPYDFVHVRYAESNEHTWRITDEDFMRPAVCLATGLRLDLAFSGGCRSEETYRTHLHR